MDGQTPKRIRNLDDERSKAEVRRVTHEFATYLLWHVSYSKPQDITKLRQLVNRHLAVWANHGFNCGTKDCAYCSTEVTTKNFRGMFRRLIGKSERGKV